MSTRNRTRPLLAVLLAFLYPGLGHVYLREWLRALVWFFLNVTSFTLLMPPDAVPESFGWSELVAAAENVSPEAALALAAITVFSMVDAYWMAKRQNTEVEVEAGTTCPNCGRDVDQDLEFCHWCTERLKPESASDSEESADDSGANA
ncbi:zinc ribbon domain-containing protein [Halosimplex litoreum]|uniref:Zinc ribbon domain-containing protein n=1 Tax=Halosimplex litoreum TaxID=1198301 RepID=A0A7T3G120_9EURY|nr:zinc ribbon domain-containing protein [Halosimplex litoreum]QPV63968.1 zinc ribbon domain-containing protein [Halosimplex litoreum]